MAIAILCIFLASSAQGSKQVALEEPTSEIFRDETEEITLAKNELFTLPITTRTITHTLETLPENSK
jgi:hypothetical protein